MRKSKGSSGDGSDARKHNTPPEHGKIKPKEIRNPWGRAGKPDYAPPTTMDELFWQEAARIVSQGIDGPVDVKQRLIQEEIHAALQKGDSAARVRLLAQLQDTGARIEHQRHEFLTFFIEAKAHLSERFYGAQMFSATPPEVLPHPAHVRIRNDQVDFCGPIDRAGRAAWEHTKAAIRIAACLHDMARSEYRRNRSTAVLKDLRAFEKHRRSLMRAVPKGWNWREEIYSRDSMLAFAKETVTALKEIGYVPADDID